MGKFLTGQRIAIMKSGIYKIINKLDGKFYYGQAIDFDDRWRNHKNELKNNKHFNSHLQNAWNKYGEENFEFSIILTCEIKELDYYEQCFLDKYWDNCKNCYNIAKDVHNPMRGRKHTEEWKKNQSKKTKGKKLSDETKKKIGQANAGKVGNWLGKKHTEETKKKMSEVAMGKKYTGGNFNKMTKANKSGYVGVSWYKKDERWEVIFKNNYLGRYKTLEEAVKVREKAYQEYLKERKTK